MTFETVIIYRFKSYDIWYMYDSVNNVIGFEYSQLSEINKTLKTTRIYYEKNLQGDVTGLLDARGAEIASYTYDACGNVITDTEKSFCYEGYEVPFELNHVLYRGYYYDGSCTDTESDTNLYYLQSRYYDAEVGRFINADDVSVLSVELCSIFEDNLYIYCNSNPVNNSDPNGYIAQAILGAATGLLVSALLYYVEYKLGMRKWSWWSFSIIVAMNAVMGAVVTSSVGSKLTDLLKLSSKASRKLGATGIGLKYLRFLAGGMKFFINAVVKKLTRKPGESWYKAARRWLGI